MKAIVFGGTGFIGSHVVEQLHLASYQVSVAVRKTSNTDFIHQLGVPSVEFEATDLSSITNAIDGHDVVVNCTADHQGAVRNQDGEPIEIFLTRGLVEGAALAGVKRFIQLSSIIVYDFLSNEPMDETYHSQPEHVNQQLSLERERIVMETANQSGMTTYILRPASTIGVRDVSSFFSRMFTAHLNDRYPMVGSGETRVSMVDTRDIGRAIGFLGFETPHLDGGIFLLKGFDTTWKELKEAIDGVRGIRSIPLSIPEKLTDEQLSEYGLTPFTYQNFSTNRLWNDQKLRSLGFKTIHTLSESVQTAAQDITRRLNEC